MQLATVSTPPTRGPLLDNLLATANGQRGTTLLTKPVADDAREKDGQRSETPAVTESARVRLSATPRAGSAPATLPPVYAEIWKNGVKLAIVDSTGGVRSVNGVIAPSFGTGGVGGLLLAARRAAEIAGSVGGEIHAGGQTVDQRTLFAKTKLDIAYGLTGNSG